MTPTQQPVSWIVDRLATLWGEGAALARPTGEPAAARSALPRARLRQGPAQLGWRPVWASTKRFAGPSPGTAPWPRAPTCADFTLASDPRAPRRAWRTLSPRMDADLIPTPPSKAFAPRATPNACARRSWTSRSLYAETGTRRARSWPGVSRSRCRARSSTPRTCARWWNSALDFWLTTGRFNDAFERSFAKFLGLRHALTWSTPARRPICWRSRADLAQARRAAPQAGRRGHHRRHRISDHRQSHPAERPGPGLRRRRHPDLQRRRPR